MSTLFAKLNRAAVLVGTALAVVPGLTANGCAEGPALTEPAVLHEVACAADWLQLCEPSDRFRPSASTSLLAELAADRTGALRVGPGALLAAAIGLGLSWMPIPDSPYALLAVRPPPRWHRPTPEGAVKALRRLGGLAGRGVLEAVLADACTREGAAPPAGRVSEAVDAAVGSGAISVGAGQLRLGGAA